MRGVVFVTGSMSPTIVPKSTIANSKLTPGGEVNISYFQITMLAILCPCNLTVLMLCVLCSSKLLVRAFEARVTFTAWLSKDSDGKMVPRDWQTTARLDLAAIYENFPSLQIERLVRRT